MENDSSNITVSICSITYNHAHFIRECLDGFLMQKTNFNYEIIINDDCSTDETTEILREYEEKYPHLIKVIYHEQNQYSQGVREIFQKFVFPLVKGKYVALCEGDDYWTDPLKLQKQVDFMDGHPDFSLCFHDVAYISYIHEDTSPFSHLKSKEYGLNEIFPQWTVPTCSAVFRSTCIAEIPHHKDFLIGDNVIFLTCAIKGKLYCLNEKMATYRRHENGWTASSTIISNLITHTKALKESFKYKIPREIFDKQLIQWHISILNESRWTFQRYFIEGLKVAPCSFLRLFSYQAALLPIIRKIRRILS